jgi:hypothetical protein
VAASIDRHQSESLRRYRGILIVPGANLIWLAQAQRILDGVRKAGAPE